MKLVPFRIDSIYAGLGACNGLLRDEGEQLCLEFEIKDSVVGLLKSGVKQVRIPMKDLVSVTLVKGWLGRTWLGVKIVIQAAQMTTLKDVPGTTGGRVELSIARKDREAAEEFVASLHTQDEPPE